MRNILNRYTVAIKATNNINKLSIVIPSAGLGTRMKSYGPKSLLNINNTYLITHQLNVIKNAINIPYEIILVAGHEADKVFKNTPHDIIKIENECYEETNVVRSIGLALHACTTQNVLLIYGDLLFNKYALNVPLDKDSWLSTSTTMSDNEIGCTIDNNHIINLAYDLPIKWSQIGFFTGREFTLLQNICCQRDNSQLFGFEAINKIIDKGGTFCHLSPKLSKTNDIDSSKDLQIIKDIL